MVGCPESHAAYVRLRPSRIPSPGGRWVRHTTIGGTGSPARILPRATVGLQSREGKYRTSSSSVRSISINRYSAVSATSPRWSRLVSISGSSNRSNEECGIGPGSRILTGTSSLPPPLHRVKRSSRLSHCLAPPPNQRQRSGKARLRFATTPNAAQRSVSDRLAASAQASWRWPRGARDSA